MRPDEGSEALRDHQQAMLTLLDAFDRVCKKLRISYILFAGTLLGAVRHEGFIPWDDDLDVAMLRDDYERFLSQANEVLDENRFFLQKEFSDHWPVFFSKLRLNHTACLEKYHPRDPLTHQGVYMDIFPCDNASDNQLFRRLQFLASRVVVAKALDRRGYDTDSCLKKCFIWFCHCLPMKPFRKLVIHGKDQNSEYVHSFFGASSHYASSVYPRRLFEECTEKLFERRRFPVPADSHALLRILYGDYMRLPDERERRGKVHAILVDLQHSWQTYGHCRDQLKFQDFTRSIR